MFRVFLLRILQSEFAYEIRESTCEVRESTCDSTDIMKNHIGKKLIIFNIKYCLYYKLYIRLYTVIRLRKLRLASQLIGLHTILFAVGISAFSKSL